MLYACLFAALFLGLGTIDLGDGSTFGERWLARSAFVGLFSLARWFGHWAEVLVIALAISALAVKWLSRPKVRETLVCIAYVVVDCASDTADRFMTWLNGEHPVWEGFLDSVVELIAQAADLCWAIWQWARGEHPWLKKAGKWGLGTLLSVAYAWSWLTEKAGALWTKIKPAVKQVGWLVFIPAAGLGIVLASPVLLPAVALYLLYKGGETFLPLAVSWAAARFPRWREAAQTTLLGFFERWREAVLVTVEDWIKRRGKAMLVVIVNLFKCRGKAARIAVANWIQPRGGAVALVACCVVLATTLVNTKSAVLFGPEKEGNVQIVAHEEAKSDREESLDIVQKLRLRKGEESIRELEKHEDSYNPLIRVDRWLEEEDKRKRQRQRRNK